MHNFSIIADKSAMIDSINADFLSEMIIYQCRQSALIEFINEDF